MILVAYRHGLRASEVCGLEWHQVELDQGRLHVRRAKNGTPSVHPIRGDEIRALRRLRRENPKTPMCSSASVVDQSAQWAFITPWQGSARPQRCPLPSTLTCCATPVAISSPTMGMILVPCSTTWATRISSTRCAIRSFRLTASATSGGAEVATTRHRFGLLRGSGSIVPQADTTQSWIREHPLVERVIARLLGRMRSERQVQPAAADVDNENPGRHDAKSKISQLPRRKRSGSTHLPKTRRGSGNAGKHATP